MKRCGEQNEETARKRYVTRLGYCLKRHPNGSRHLRRHLWLEWRRMSFQSDLCVCLYVCSVVEEFGRQMCPLSDVTDACIGVRDPFSPFLPSLARALHHWQRQRQSTGLRKASNPSGRQRALNHSLVCPALNLKQRHISDVLSANRQQLNCNTTPVLHSIYGILL